MGELKCVGSERLVRLGISMTQLHVMHLLDRHGEMAMSRLADMLDVSLSAATGLIDRVEERGFVERIRVPEDRRIVLVRITAGRSPDARRRRARSRTEILERVLDRLDETQLDRRRRGDGRPSRSPSTRPIADPASGVHHSHQAQGRD